MSDVMTDAAVVIPTLGRLGTVHELCVQLGHLSPRPAVIVPVFQRADEFAEFASFELAAHVKPLLCEIRGAGPARNAGVDELPSNILYVGFLDDDVLPLAKSWLSDLVDPLRSGELSATTGAVLGWDSHPNSPLLPPWRANVVLPMIMHPLGNPTRSRDGGAGTVWGGNFAVSTGMFRAIGGFHPGFRAPSLYEETEFSIRLRRDSAKQIRYIAGAAVRHAQEAQGGQRDSVPHFDPDFVYGERLKLIQTLSESDPHPFVEQRLALGRAILGVLRTVRGAVAR